MDRFWERFGGSSQPTTRWLRFTGYWGLFLGAAGLTIGFVFVLQGEVVAVATCLGFAAFSFLFARDAFRDAHRRAAQQDQESSDGPE